MEAVLWRLWAAALLGGLAAWLLILFPFGAVGLRNHPVVRLAASIVGIVALILGFFQI